jgi:hypothetical protein
MLASAGKMPARLEERALEIKPGRGSAAADSE